MEPKLWKNDITNETQFGQKDKLLSLAGATKITSWGREFKKNLLVWKNGGHMAQVFGVPAAALNTWKSELLQPVGSKQTENEKARVDRQSGRKV